MGSRLDPMRASHSSSTDTTSFVHSPIRQSIRQSVRSSIRKNKIKYHCFYVQHGLRLRVAAARQALARIIHHEDFSLGKNARANAQTLLPSY